MRNSSKSKVIHRQDDDSLRRRIAKLEAENRLLSNEMAEIRDLLDGSVQGIMIHRDYKPLYANAAFAAILGYSGPAEIMQIGTTLSLFAEEEREKAQTIAEARRQGGDAPDVPSPARLERADHLAVQVPSLGHVSEPAAVFQRCDSAGGGGPKPRQTRHRRPMFTVILTAHRVTYKSPGRPLRVRQAAG